MLDKKGLEQILYAVSKRWNDISNDPKNKALQTLPNNFWMNAAGGRAGEGKWVTMIMYTENDSDAETIRQVLQNWQAKGAESKKPVQDLIQISRKKD